MRKEDLQRVIELDEHATMGPWEPNCDGTMILSNYLGRNATTVPVMAIASDTWGMNGEKDQETMLHYRTAAPEMARILLEIHEALDAGAEDCDVCEGTGETIDHDRARTCVKCLGAGCISAEEVIKRILGR